MPRFGTLFICFLFNISLSAQQSSLVDLIKNLSDREDVSFSYDPDLLTDVILERDFGFASELINFLNTNSALKVEEVSQGDYLISPKKTKVELSMANAQEPMLQAFYLDIIRGENEVLYQNFISDPGESLSFNWTPKRDDTIKFISTAYDPIYIPGNELLIDLKKEIVLKEKVTYLEEIVIQNYLAKGIELSLEDHTTRIDMNDLALIPGETDGDVLASLATLPGINSPDSRPGNLFIRGSSTDQNLILYNNIPIYHRGHYYGSISPYNPAMISNIKVSKNGFNPRLGGRVGGAIEIRSQDELSEYDSYGVGLNSLYGNVFLKSKINENLGVSLSARHSLPSGWISPKLREISTMAYSATVLTDPQSGINFNDINVGYEDYNFNLVWQLNRKNKLKLSGLYTNNSTDYTILNDTIQNLEKITYDNEGISLEWDKIFSTNVTGKLITFFSDYYSAFETTQLNLQLGENAVDVETENYLTDAGLSYEWNITKGDWNTVELGIASQWSRVKFEYGDIQRGRDPVIIKPRPDETYIHALYGNYKFNGTSIFYYQLGGRLEYYTRTGKPYFSPRLFMNYDMSDEIVLKASVGRYFQFLNQMKYLNFGNAGFDNELWRLADDRGIKALYSDQAMIGGVWTKNRLVLDIETYRKRINDVNYASTFRLTRQTEFSAADWDVKGFDFFTKVQVTNGFSLWSSYEYSEQTLAFDSLTSVSYQYKNNRPHRFKMGGLYQRGNLKVSFSGKVLSGLYGRSIDILAELDQITILDDTRRPPPPAGGTPPDGMPPPNGMGPPPMGPRFRPATISDLPVRYETFYGFDFFATYQLPKTSSRKWDTIIGLSIINVFDIENQIDQVVRGGTQRNLNERYSLGFAPNLNLTLKW